MTGDDIGLPTGNTGNTWKACPRGHCWRPRLMTHGVGHEDKTILAW